MQEQPRGLTPPGLHLQEAEALLDEYAGTAGTDFRKWHVGDFGQCLTLVGDAPNNGHVSEEAKPTPMTRQSRRW
jgi:hypothetical protein